MWVVQVVAVQHHLLLDEGRVEPEVEGGFLVPLGHALRVSLEEDTDVAVQRRTIDQLDRELVGRRVIDGLAVASIPDVRTKNLIAATLVDVEPEVVAVPLANIHHPVNGYFLDTQRPRPWQLAPIVMN